MAQAMNGVISNVSSKAFNDRKTGQPITLYSFQIEGSNRWFRTGTSPVPAGRGDSVKFVVDGQNVDVSSMEVQQGSSGSAAKSATASSPATKAAPRASGTAASRDEYWANKEARDLEKEQRYQTVSEPRMAYCSALSAAAQVTVAALQTDALGFGTAAKSKRLDMLASYVEELTLRFARNIENAPELIKEVSADSAASNDEGDTDNDE